ncbi:MAG: YebC/PmpR family DNA-binding transcriptional regulator [Planctomycetaceae bacterium]|nr:YebC/PmpR family DNA-binding transcriptional regulator [Planctomycetaceae bacterium]
MAGHSHSANIAHRKGRVDKVRGALFGKLSRAIIVAARRGGADPAANITLRVAIEKARKNSMPKDNIERAIKRGAGETEGQDFSEVMYEGYGAGGVAILCDALTDNRNRTAGELRKTFEVHGGNLGGAGCVGWMFERKGMFVIAKADATEERLFEVTLEAGADDVKDLGETFEVTCPADAYLAVVEALTQAGISSQSSELSRIASQTVAVDGDNARRVLKLIDALEENEDVQTVTANYDMPESVLQAALAE